MRDRPRVDRTPVRARLRGLIQKGEPAPDFEAKTTDGKVLRLSRLRGQPVVLYFFPRAFTAG